MQTSPTTLPESAPPSSSTPTTPAPVQAPGLRVKSASPNPSSTPSATTAPAPESLAPAAVDPVEDGAAGGEAGIRSGNRRSPGRPPKALRQLARGVVTMLGLAAHQLAGTRAQAAGLWLPDDDTVRGVGDPLAAIIGRHTDTDTAGAAANPDLADALTAGMALLAYLVTHVPAAVRLRLETRRAARNPAAGVLEEPEPWPASTAPAPGQ